MKIIYTIFLLLATYILSFSQPNWDPTIYPNLTTTVYAIVTVNDLPASEGDIIGAFVGSECRDVKNIFIDNGNTYVALSIQTKEKGEEVNFKLYDSSEDQILEIANTTFTDPGETIGAPPNYLQLAAISIINLEAPKLKSPKHNSTTTNKRPRLEWYSVPSGERYQRILANNPSFNSPLINDNSSALSRTPSNDLPDGVYYWKVRALTNSIDGPWSDTWKFTVTTTPTSVLSVTPLNQSVTATSSSTTFSVSSNVSWTASESESWITSVSPSFGSNNGTLTINYTTNSSTSSRTGIITISGGGINRQVTVTQAGSAPTTTLDVTPQNQNVSSSSGSITFNINSNASWEVSKNVGWITSISPSSGSNNATITVNYSANTESQRVGTITLSGGGLTKQATVTQAAILESNYLFEELFNNIDEWNLVVNGGNGSFTSKTFDNETVGTFYMEGSPANVYVGKILSKSIPAGSILKVKWYYESSGIYQNSENSGGGSIIFMNSIPNVQSAIPAATILTVFESRTYPMRQWNEEEFEISQSIPAGSYIVIGGSVWPSYIINNWDYITISQSIVNVNNSKNDIIPRGYFLSQNYPNPFNPTTNISFGLPKQSAVSLIIYDITGQTVEIFLNNEMLPAGSYSYSFEAKNLSSGIYFYILKAGDFVQTKKLILMK